MIRNVLAEALELAVEYDRFARMLLRDRLIIRVAMFLGDRAINLSGTWKYNARTLSMVSLLKSQYDGASSHHTGDRSPMMADGIAAYCKPENKVSLGFVEGLNNKVRVIQRRAYGLRDEKYLRLKILTCMLLAL